MVGRLQAAHPPREWIDPAPYRSHQGGSIQPDRGLSGLRRRIGTVPACLWAAIRRRVEQPASPGHRVARSSPNCLRAKRQLVTPRRLPAAPRPTDPNATNRARRLIPHPLFGRSDHATSCGTVIGGRPIPRRRPRERPDRLRLPGRLGPHGASAARTPPFTANGHRAALSPATMQCDGPRPYASASFPSREHGRELRGPRHSSVDGPCHTGGAGVDVTILSLSDLLHHNRSPGDRVRYPSLARSSAAEAP